MNLILTKSGYKIFVGLLLIGQSAIVFGQDNPVGRLFTGNSADGSAIFLKWVVPGFGSPEGFQVYRQKDGETEWVLLNNSPIKKMAKLELAAKDRDDVITYLENNVFKTDINKAEPFSLLLLSRKMVELEGVARYLGLFYRDETVQNGQTYRYKVTKIEKSGEKLVGISNAILAKPFEPIEPPLGVKVYIDEKKDALVKIFWKPEEARYFAVNVYRALKGEELSKISKTPAVPTLTKDAKGELGYPDAFYERGDHEPGNTYTYQLKGIDFFGRESSFSAPFDIEIIDRTPPSPPTSLETVRTGPREVMVSWAASDAKNLVGYNVYVADSLTAIFTKVNEAILPTDQSTFTYKITDEKWGDRFFYVEAINAFGTHSASTKMGLTVWDVIAPQAPTGLTTTPSEGAILLSWNSLTEADLSGYLVYRSVANTPGAPYALVSGGAIESTSFLDSLPREARNKYYYKVAAVDFYGNLSARSEIVSATMPDVIAPISPTIKSIEIKGDTAIIAWLPSIDDELKGYHLFRCTEADTNQWTFIGGELLSPYLTQYTDTRLEPNSTYCYQITAEDLTGNKSTASNRYTVQTRPHHGEDFVAGKLTATYVKRKKEAVISWKSDATASVQGSILYRKEGNSRFFPLTELMSKETEYTDKDIEPDKTYSYQIRTYYADGNMTLSEPAAILAK